jgi:hypothetical protein
MHDLGLTRAVDGDLEQNSGVPSVRRANQPSTTTSASIASMPRALATDTR